MFGGAAFWAAFRSSKLASRPILSPAVEIDPSERNAMAGVAEEFRRTFDAPGLSIAIAREGRFVYQQAFGLTGPASHEPLTPAHLFRIASVSKPITSATIFSLIEKGRLHAHLLDLGSPAS